MFGRILDVLSLDTKLMCASTNLFVAKENAARNLREIADEARDIFKDEELDPDEERDDESDDLESGDDGDEAEDGITGFVMAAVEQVKKNKEKKQEEEE